MQLLTVVLGLPGTIGFATGLAHLRAPNLWGKQGWYTGKGIIAWDLTHGNYGSTTRTDSFVDSLLALATPSSIIQHCRSPPLCKNHWPCANHPSGPSRGYCGAAALPMLASGVMLK